jgi:nucleoid-associated protein YgaU
MIGVYVTKENDTLQRIAAKFYGDWTCYKIILDANYSKIQNLTENILQGGIPLEIPEINLLDETHIVSQNDTYESISKKYYNTESYSEFLRYKNNELVLKYNIGKEILIPSLIQNV